MRSLGTSTAPYRDQRPVTYNDVCVHHPRFKLFWASFWQHNPGNKIADIASWGPGFGAVDIVAVRGGTSPPVVIHLADAGSTSGFLDLTNPDNVVNSQSRSELIAKITERYTNETFVEAIRLTPSSSIPRATPESSTTSPSPRIVQVATHDIKYEYLQMNFGISQARLSVMEQKYEDIVAKLDRLLRAVQPIAPSREPGNIGGQTSLPQSERSLFPYGEQGFSFRDPQTRFGAAFPFLSGLQSRSSEDRSTTASASSTPGLSLNSQRGTPTANTGRGFEGNSRATLERTLQSWVDF
ncbi:hypothetical protein M427DRAFT_400262 [Gonapodya prolifera JEL478]|uniref:Uncharacterized protein n=1 Tax=Gonapodya prolifera (strain JEL478) TaxID=1344416 RepID=A0A139ATG1_GONPJ|nr:hypothetical protein M427DRAFT_400262 [Gonapodya prolifera JEL478]|eukprot:KXS20016.1 hypothetical protein M427DRAFT_400262 [Gonapodya prolifera JEL478]